MAKHNRAKGTGRKFRPAIVAGAVLLFAAAAVAGWRLYDGLQEEKRVSAALDTDAFYPGIVVGGVELGGKSMSGAKAAVEAALPPEEGRGELEITHDGRSWKLTEEELGYRYDTDAVLKEAYSYARSGDRDERYRLVERLRESPKTYDLKKTLDETVLSAALGKIADAVDTAPQGPKVVSFDAKKLEFQFQDAVPGVSVNRDALVNDAKAALSSGKKTVELVVSEAGSQDSLAELKAHMKKLGSFSTVSKNSAAGTFNMARALAAASGTEVGPGETFSFFGTVGECDKAQGYKPAGAILNGRMVQEYGGGICQASTTLYGAAVRSGMTVVERHNHSIPSSYCQIGQDATVSYPTLDFKFKNPTSYPVYIVASAKNKVMTATLYGYQPDGYDSIQVTSQVTETIPAPSQARYSVDSSLAKGAVRLDAKARTGYRAAAKRIYLQNGKTVKTEDLPTSYYRPQPAFYSYGKGTDLGKPASKPESKPASQPQSKPESKPESQPASSPPSVGGNEEPPTNDDVTAAGDAAA